MWLGGRGRDGGFRVSFWNVENVLKLDCGDGCPTLKYTKNHWIVSFKWMNGMVCELYLNKLFIWKKIVNIQNTVFSDYFSLPMLLKLFTKRCYSSAPLYMMLNWQGLLRSCLSQTARWQWVIILCTNPLGRLFCLSFRCENNDLHHCKKYNDTRKDFMTNKIIRIWYINKISSFILLTPLTNTCWELHKIQNWIRSYFYMQSSLSQEHSMC